MDLEQLKQIDAIARYGTLSAAAKVLHVSQPALSRSVQRLEIELGQELFSRSKNHIELNEAGRITLEHARAILREERSLRDDLDRLVRRSRTLLVGAVAPAPVWRLTALTVERFPGTILQPITLDHDAIVKRLADRSIDFAVTTSPLDHPGCRCVRFMDESLFASIPTSHPLATEESLGFAQLDGEDYLVDSSAGFWLDMVRRRMPRARIIEQSDRKVLSKLLENSPLLSFTTDITLDWNPGLDRVNIPIVDGDAHVSFHLTVMSDAPQAVAEVFEWVGR